MVADRALGLKAPVVLSPGRNFAAAATGDGFAWFRLPEWEPAGTLRLPEGMPTVLAFGADGKPIRLPLVGAVGIDGYSEARIEEMK